MEEKDEHLEDAAPWAREVQLLPERDDLSGALLRDFTFDEATHAVRQIMQLAWRRLEHDEEPPHGMPDGLLPFSVREAMDAVAALQKIDPSRLFRPCSRLLNQLVAGGVLVEVLASRVAVIPSGSRAGVARGVYLDPKDRTFVPAGSIPWGDWPYGEASRALGLEYVAHVFGDVTMRVHSFSSKGEGIGSGVVIADGIVLTNEHVVRGATDVAISVRDEVPRPAKVVWTHPDAEKFDLALIELPGVQATPGVRARAPSAAESVVVLAYPYVPRVLTRPVLYFDGTVSSSGLVATYYGEEQTIVSAVMSPGASGGPIFGDDGALLGIVVQALIGEDLEPEAGDGEPSTILTTFHAIVPSQVIGRELRAHVSNREWIDAFSETEYWRR